MVSFHEHGAIFHLNVKSAPQHLKQDAMGRFYDIFYQIQIENFRSADILLLFNSVKDFNCLFITCF